MTSSEVAVKIDPDIKKRLQNLAKVKQCSAYWLVQEAINQYVEREERLQSFRQDALCAWKEYQETGLHVTSDEVVDWLKTWGEEEEKDRPECHR